ncbi:SRPBCC domain-containing protein [Streptomyces cellulosae]|uniref:SRPBCC domain-containing protein n=1 Tax=Streptomyces cellulosae TaxID=1968 RepID=UPI0004CC883A|nr:SRPBCC domain-containing protein [Streptomyces cellulosae]
MEHEVFVPVPAERLREALADPARVARAVPGLQQDAGAEPVAGRLKVRVGSHSVTYRGSVRITGQDDGSYAIEGDATETRGTGVVKLALTLSLREADGGATVRFEGTASADGRVTELPPDAVASATGRLLSRFAENLGTLGAADEVGPLDEPPPGKAPEEPQAPEPPAPVEPPAPIDLPPAAFEAEVPPSALPEDFPGDDAPPAEAAHARRTMIGRSAEEVDHAPPRGRYAPVPAPQTIAPNPVLRWAAPAAAVALASAIVVTRALRRRR